METEIKGSITNKAYSKSMMRIHSAGIINREDILNNFSPDSIINCWEIFCKYLIKNYKNGKGTIVPKFGLFTFNYALVCLEGTTNESIRDLKPRKPIFIVSKDFVEKLRSGIYIPNTGIIYYNQIQNNRISVVKINYAELALPLKMKKEEVQTILDNLIKFIGDSIIKGEFKNKEMPGIGALLVKNNIIAVKFNDEFVDKIKLMPQKLINTKKDINLNMNVTTNKENKIGVVKNHLPQLGKSLMTFRSKTAVLNSISNDGEKWLKENYDLNIDQIEENSSDNFINDIVKKFIHDPKKLEELKISKKILESIYFHRSVILSELKKHDKGKNGVITRSEFLTAFEKSSLDSKLSSLTIDKIINLYANKSTDLIAYNNVFLSLLKDVELFLKNESVNLDDKEKSYHSLTEYKSRPTSSLQTKKIEFEDVYKEIKSIKLIFSRIKQMHCTKYDQNISQQEFISILRENSIVIPRDKISRLINYLEISNSNSFSLCEFANQLEKFKIFSSEMSSEDIISAFNKLKDITYSLGGRKFVFDNNKHCNISKENFLNIYNGKTHFSNDVLESIFNFLTKTGNILTLEEYINHFENDKNNNLNEDFQIKAINILNEKIHKGKYQYDEYFNHLLSYKFNRSEIFLNNVEFHKAIISENFNFTAEEIDYLFSVFDYKKDKVIDREEFKNNLIKVFKPLYKIQDIIKKNNLEIEDIMFRMNLNKNQNHKLDFLKFKSKMKLFDSTYDHEFIQSLFNEIKIGTGDASYVDRETIQKFFDVYKKENFSKINNQTFQNNFIRVIKHISNFNELKKQFEKIDSFNNGLLSKVDLCNVIQKLYSDFKDEDIMKFIRINSLYNGDKVNYTKFLELIFYDNKNDKFTECVELLANYLTGVCNNDLFTLFGNILHIEYKKTIGKVFIPNESIQSISIEKLHEFIKENLKINFDKNIICKFDVDQDGKISFNDMESVLSRYSKTSYFKFENCDKELPINFHAKEVLNEEKFKQIVRDIKTSLKRKNMTEIGLFKKLDANKDGFVSHPEFCQNLANIIELAPSIKDQLFNYLDVRSIGMINLETFLKRFKEFNSDDVIIRNNWDTENFILDRFSIWIRNNTKLSENELYSILDFDCDGTINLNDFKRFIIEKLDISKVNVDDIKIKRVMQQISLTKNNNLGIADITEFFKKSYKLENLNISEKNLHWIDEVIERLGLFISENYESLRIFFEDINSKKDGKLRIEEFKIFHEKNFKCFEGFNLTSDEIEIIYSTLDPHKKSYITFDDLANKLSVFDYYKKMHSDIKNFLSENFRNGKEVFKYIIKHEDKFITLKHLYEGMNNLFPNKYQTDTLLNYIKKYFKYTDKISFSELDSMYFDEMKTDDTAKQNNLNSIKRIKTANFLQREVNESNSVFPNTTRVKSSIWRINSDPKSPLVTPFDHDPLEKIKRIINSSRFDHSNFFKMYELISDNGFLNEFEFRNMIKKLNLGLTSLEIDTIINRSGKSKDGKIKLKDFVRFISLQDSNLVQLKNNLKIFISDIKQIIYKYYSNAKLAFQFNDTTNSNLMDFDKFKNIIFDLFEKESRPKPNFALIKNAFEYIDSRKDGLIDINEWLKTFSTVESILDNKNILNKSFLKSVREWENSIDVSNIYQIITRSKKLIKEKTKNLLIKNGKISHSINSQNLINVLKENLSQIQLSNTQWKIIVSIADREKNSMIDLDLFLNLVEHSTKLSRGHPKILS